MTSDFCTNYSVLYIIDLLMKVFNAACVILPLVLIVLIMIDYFKAITSSEDNALQNTTKKSAKRILAAIIIFFIPTIVTTTMSFVSLSAASGVTDCIINSKNLEFYKDLEEEEENDSLGFGNDLIEVVIGNYNSSTTTEGTSIGKTYNLSEEEKKFLTSVAICENGLDGMKAELCLMANLFELLPPKEQEKYETLTNYVLKGPWFACGHDGRNTLTKYSNYKEEGMAITEEVLVLGNRPYPYYINEHDCWECSKEETLCHNTFRGDICTLKVNGQEYKSLTEIKNKNNYIKNKTVIYNAHKSVYTFYEFPCKSCDPFGYTKEFKDRYDKLNGS